MTYSLRNILVAVVTAAAAAVLVLLYTTTYKDDVAHRQNRVTVLVARSEIAIGTPAAKAATLLEARDVLVTDRTPGALENTKSIAGLVATQTVYPGQQVVDRVFGPSTKQPPAVQLKPTERGVRLAVDGVNGAIGAIHPGDHVDVFASFTVKWYGVADERHYTRLLLANVPVLEAPETAGVDGKATSSVMLAVSQKDATKLSYAGSFSESARLWLVVRPAAGAQEQPKSVESIENMLLEGLSVNTQKELLLRVAAARKAEETAESKKSAAAKPSPPVTQVVPIQVTPSAPTAPETPPGDGASAPATVVPPTGSAKPGTTAAPTATTRKAAAK